AGDDPAEALDEVVRLPLPADVEHEGVDLPVVDRGGQGVGVDRLRQIELQLDVDGAAHADLALELRETVERVELDAADDDPVARLPRRARRHRRSPPASLVRWSLEDQERRV